MPPDSPDSLRGALRELAAISWSLLALGAGLLLLLLAMPVSLVSQRLAFAMWYAACWVSKHQLPSRAQVATRPLADREEMARRVARSRERLAKTLRHP